VSERQPRANVSTCGLFTFALMLLAALLAPHMAQAAKPGHFDRSFGGDGKVEACGGHGGHFVPVAIDSRDRIVAAGSRRGRFVVARYIGYRRP
jgi:hypothetical protein